MKLWIVLAMALILAACGGGGGGGGDDNPPPPDNTGNGVINGLVTDSSTGARLKNVSVSAAGKTVASNDDGEFTLDGLPSGDVVIAFTLDEYAPGYANAVAGSDPTPVLTALKKEGQRQPYSLDESKTISQTTEAGPYAVIFTANSMNTSDSNLTVSVTPLDPTKEIDALPGELATSDALLLPLTFAEFSIFDTAGNRVNLKDGATAIVELPIPPELRGLPEYQIDDSNPKVIHCYSYNPVTGQWEDFVDGVIVRSSVDGVTPVVRASIKHFSWYGAAPESQDCVDVYGRVVGPDGSPVAGARVEVFPGAVTTSDANGYFIVRTTPDREVTIVATRTYIDTNGSVSGTPGAKVVEYGEVASVPLTSLITRPCNSPAVTDPAQTGSNTPVIVKLGNIGTVSYDVMAWLTDDGAVAYVYEMLPNGGPNQDAVVIGAKITLSDNAGNTWVMEELIVEGTSLGIYLLDDIQPAAGRRYTLAIDLGDNGSIDGSGSVFAVGDVTWVSPADGSSVSSNGLIASWNDSAANSSGYSVLYYVAIESVASTDFAFYMGSDAQFDVTSVINPGQPLAPGEYEASVMAFSGPMVAGEFNITNNITGPAVNGVFYSFASEEAGSPVNFTVSQ